MKRWLERLIPARAWFPLALALLWNLLAYYGGRALALPVPPTELALPLDGRIPFLPWTVSIYVLSYLFWVVNYILAARRDWQFARRFFLADFLTRCVCFLCFVFFPTTILRPEVTGSGFWNVMMRILYSSDAADNLFPSIHCAASTLCVLAVWGDPKIPRWYRGVSILFAAAVFLSTLTTKQHVLLDVPGGVAVALICYGAAALLLKKKAQS